MAAAFISKGLMMRGVDYQVEGSGRTPIGYFKFDDTAERREAEEAFVQGRMLVEPRQFAENIRTLKAQTTNFQKSPLN